MIKEDYRYTDTGGREHKIPIVSFAHPTYDARSACIGAVNAELLAEPTFEGLASDYRDLGAPLLFFCCKKELQWWGFTTQGSRLRERIPAQKVGNFFSQHSEEFRPESIYRAKTLARLPSEEQLAFVDVGLMPLLEYEMGNQVSRLMRRMLDALENELGKQTVDQKAGRWLFQSAFWLLGARILRDKRVPEFSDLDLRDVPETLRKIHNHYKAEQPPERVTQRQREALRAAGEIVERFGNMANLTIESLAYVYENSLITREIRKALGIHATPSYLVDYIVWQLAPWIEKIPPEERTVLEPTCGHAPFLVSAARLLREMIDEEDPKKRHKYLKDHLVGVETDLFAREIARLSLTLADVPNPNGWQLRSRDVFDGKALSNVARRCTILLCNPPFQDFRPGERARYTKIGATLAYRNKAAEVLARTLPYMPYGSVVGVIVPRGFLSRQDVTPLRKMLAEDFEIYEVCTLPDNVFASADHESAVILGRKKTRKPVVSVTRYVRVRERTLDQFRQCYSAPTEVIRQDRFAISQDYVFAIPELEQVWTWCRRLDQLRMVVDEKETGKGLEYKPKEQLPPNAQTVSRSKFPGSVRGYAYFDRDLKLTECPTLWWMAISPDVIRRRGHGIKGAPQILLNSAPVRRGPWRLKACVDRKGRSLNSSFIVVRPKPDGWSLDVLWAILNSPLANAYAYCHGTKRLVGREIILRLPVPKMSIVDLNGLDDLVKKYFALCGAEDKVMHAEVDSTAAMRGMLAIDAEVMRLYDLPPRLEWQVLDLFEGWKRPGVDFEFSRYFPPEFESCIPLHEYLSEEYQRSTVSFVSNWVEEVRSPEMIEALKAAEEAFRED